MTRWGDAVVRRTVLLVALIVVAASGCASIPDSGAIHNVPSSSDDPSDPQIYDPPGPTPGASPAQIADGFLEAMRALPVSSEFAREFLTDEAGRRWNPSHQTIVYSDYPDSAWAGQGRMRLTMRAHATLGSRGAYTPQRDAERGYELTMKKVDGQWRIAKLPNAYLVSETLFESYYRPLSLYFISDNGPYAVPEQVFVADGEQLATNAVNSLLRGPRAGLDQVTSTYIPKDVQLDVSVRMQDDGVAEVRLAGSLEDVPPEQRQLLSAQIVLTLRQVAGVSSVQIVANGVPYETPGVDDVQPVDAWSRYDASVARTSTALFALGDGDPVVISGGEVHEVAGPWQDYPKMRDFAVQRGLERIAGVNGAGTEVRVGSMAVGSAEPKTVLSGTDIDTPQWDPYGCLWLADTGGESTQVWAWHQGETREVDIGTLAGMRLDDIAISPDGTRFATIGSAGGKDSLYAGFIRRTKESDEPIELVDVHQVPVRSGLHALSSIAWRDSGNLAVLADLGSRSAQPYLIPLDGSNIAGSVVVGQPSLPDVGANTVVASGRISDPIYVGDDDGGLWQLDSDQRWSEITETKVWRPHFAG